MVLKDINDSNYTILKQLFFMFKDEYLSSSNLNFDGKWWVNAANKIIGDKQISWFKQYKKPKQYITIPAGAG